jgi:hypothetical protein
MRSSTTLSKQAGTAPPWPALSPHQFRPLRETAETTLQLSCDVVFGSPSDDCRGTGICRISARVNHSPSPAARRQKCQSSVGLLFPIEGGYGLTMILTKAMLCTQLYRKHFRKGYLCLESPSTLPEELVDGLCLNFNELKPGIYPVTESSEFLRIDFQDATQINK